MPNEKKLVSLLIPCYNEEHSIPHLYEELDCVLETVDYDFEILFVNDGSTDGTLSIIEQLHQQDPKVSFVSLSRNFGKENAMLAGFDYVNGDCVIILDADLQDPPLLIPKMISYWEQGYHDVYARRADRGKESWLRHWLTMRFYRILSHSAPFETLPNVGDFRLLDRQCIEALRQLRERDRYTKGMYCWIGFKKKELLFNRGERDEDMSKMSYSTLFNLALDGITSFTTTPLRFASVLGFVIALFAFILLLFYLTKAIIFGDIVRGFPTLVCIVLFLGGMQLLSIGILGEYIGHIFNETKQRPPYIIEKKGEVKRQKTGN